MTNSVWKLAKRKRKLCYNCDFFVDDRNDVNDLKCLKRGTYVLTPEKAEHCKNFTPKTLLVGEKRKEKQ